jgi:hypothetical protein
MGRRSHEEVSGALTNALTRSCGIEGEVMLGRGGWKKHGEGTPTIIALHHVGCGAAGPLPDGRALMIWRRSPVSTR